MLEKLFPDFTLNPTLYFMADGAYYIRKAAIQVFSPSVQRIVPMLCKWHFWHNINPKIKSNKYIPKIDAKLIIPTRFKDHFQLLQRDQDKFNVSKIIRYDIKVLQSLPRASMYLTYIKIIRPFWKQYAPLFLVYFFENYVDVTKTTCLTGWQNYIKSHYPSTNNSLESFNRIMKEVMTEYHLLPFNDYVSAVFEELKRKSKEDGAILQFPQIPKIDKPIILLAQHLSEEFDDYFEMHNEKYFIKDRLVVSSICNKKTAKVKHKIKELSIKVGKKEPEAITKFLSFYSKPRARDIQSSLRGDIQVKGLFLNAACVREINIVHVEGSQEQTYLESSCTCPDFLDYRVCIHLLSCLIKTENFEISTELKKAKKRGRKLRVASAYN